MRCNLLTAAVLAAASLLAVAGCGNSADAGPKKIRMASIIFQEDEFFHLIQLGVRDAAGKSNVELLEGSSGNKPDEEFRLVQTYTNQKVDAVLISPLSATGSVAALKQAHDAGIVVVTNNTSLAANFPAGDIECSAADLGDQTGKAAKAYIEKNLGGKARIAILAFKSQVAEQSDARVNRFKKQVTSLPGVTIVAEQDAWLSDMAVKKTGDILTANPDVDIFYGANEGGTVGAVLAVKNAGKAGKIAVFGTDVSAQSLTFLQSPDNILQAITAQKPFEMGQKSVEIALKVINKEAVDKKVVLNGMLLSRTDPAAVVAYEKQFKAWTRGE